MEFPRLVYKSASNHFLVNDEAEFNASIKDGWFPTVPEALAGKLNVEESEATETLTLKGKK